MTLLEVMVTMAVIGLVALIGYNGVRYVTKSNLREDTTEVAAILKAAHNLATTSGTHHRVVFDLDKQIYRLEMCEGEIRLRHAEREEILEAAPTSQERLSELMRSGAGSSIPPGLLEAASPEEAAQIAAALSGSRVGAARCKPPELLTGAGDSEGPVRAIRTDRGLELRSIYVQHLEGEQTGGTVTVNFFPLGHAEKAIIEIGDGDGSEYTLLVHGLTGRVEFIDGEVDADEYLLHRADGEEEEER